MSENTTPKRRGAGRPKKLLGKITQMNVKINRRQLSILDTIIRREDAVKSRPDALRYLIDGGVAK